MANFLQNDSGLYTVIKETQVSYVHVKTMFIKVKQSTKYPEADPRHYCSDFSGSPKDYQKELSHL